MNRHGQCRKSDCHRPSIWHAGRQGTRWGWRMGLGMSGLSWTLRESWTLLMGGFKICNATPQGFGRQPAKVGQSVKRMPASQLPRAAEEKSNHAWTLRQTRKKDPSAKGVAPQARSGRHSSRDASESCEELTAAPPPKRWMAVSSVSRQETSELRILKARRRDEMTTELLRVGGYER